MHLPSCSKVFFTFYSIDRFCFTLSKRFLYTSHFYAAIISGTVRYTNTVDSNSQKESKHDSINHAENCWTLCSVDNQVWCSMCTIDDFLNWIIISNWNKSRTKSYYCMSKELTHILLKYTLFWKLPPNLI